MLYLRAEDMRAEDMRAEDMRNEDLASCIHVKLTRLS